MPIAAVVGGAAVLSAVTTMMSASKASDAASDATAAQVEANDKAIAAQLQMFYTSRADLAPWREIGVDALSSLRQTLGLPALTSTASTPAASTQPVAANGAAATNYLAPSGGATQPVSTQPVSTQPVVYTPSPSTGQPVYTKSQLSNWANTVLGGGADDETRRLGKNPAALGSNEWKTLIKSNPELARQYAENARTGPAGGEAIYKNYTNTAGVMEQNLELPPQSQPPVTTPPATATPVETVPVTTTPQTTQGYTMPPGTSPAEFLKSPYYNFLLDEGINAQAKWASASGNVDAGRSVKNVERFAQGLASTEYSNYLSNWLNTVLNPQLAVAGMGQVSAGQSASQANQVGSNIGQNYLAQGNAVASGAINQANAWTGGATGVANAANQGVNNYLFYSMLQNGQYGGNNYSLADWSGGAG